MSIVGAADAIMAIQWRRAMGRLECMRNEDIKLRVLKMFNKLYPEHAGKVIYSSKDQPLDFRDVFTQSEFNDICSKIWALNELFKHQPNYKDQEFGISLEVEVGKEWDKEG